MSYLSDLNPALTQGSQNYVNQTAVLTAVTSNPSSGQFLSSIQGRASIPDITADLRASLGVERIQTQQIYPIQNEQGASGEPVYGVVNEDRGLIRFVGGWINFGPTSGNGTYGQGIYTSNVGDYIEIVFYGTNLNILLYIDSTTRNLAASVDGGAYSALSSTTGSGVLGGRNYNPNSLVSAIPTQTLGLHTVRIKDDTGSNSVLMYGFEIINSNASGLININPGTAYTKYGSYTNSSPDSVAYNAGVTGVRGGRIVRYMSGNDTFSQAFTSVNGAAAYGASADHTNEEVARIYYPREFGAGRYNATYANQDDFSLMGGSSFSARSAAFTLDDGTTTLMGAVALLGAWVSGNPEGLVIGNAGYHTLTFVGCGLDILYYDSSAGTYTAGDHTYSIDGATPANWSTIAGLTATTVMRVQKIVSGLPYGTHTFTFNRSAAAYSPILVAYKVYQPKKPSLPIGAVEICDYNVMANYVANTVAGVTTIGTGLLRKSNIREFTYVGTWPLGIDTLNDMTGWGIYTTTNGNYLEYTFFGTGFDFRNIVRASYSATNTVALQNLSSGGSLLTLNSTNFPGLTTSSYGGNTFTYATGNLAQNGGTINGSGFTVSGLPLGLYKLRVTNGTSNPCLIDAFDVITPIHVHKTNSPATLQNTLAIGSQGLTDSRTTSTTTTPKAWAQATGVTTTANTGSGIATPVPDLSTTVKTSGGPLEIIFQMAYSCATNGINNAWAIYVDGLSVAVKAEQTNGTGNLNILIGHSIVVPVSAGYHKVDLMWATQAGGYTMYLGNAQRSMTVREL